MSWASLWCCVTTWLHRVWGNLSWFVKFNHDAVTLPKKRRTSRKINFSFVTQHNTKVHHYMVSNVPLTASEPSYELFSFQWFFLLFYSMQVSTKALDCKMPVACFDQESVLISSEASWTGSVNILLLYWQLQPYWTLSGLTCIANLPGLFNWKLLTLKCGYRKFMKLDKRSFGSVMFSFHTN